MRLIDLDDDRHYYCGSDGEYEKWNIDPDVSTIDPVKHGKWRKEGDTAWKCSSCGEISCCAGAYCPECGARMEGEEDETD